MTVRRWLCVGLMGLSIPAFAAQTRASCHVTYGGVTNTQAVMPTTSPYQVPARQVGSFFKFRVVWVQAPEADAGFHVYVYADDPDGPILVQQASYPAFSPTRSEHGFTGLQRVYEPRRDGELQYWCEQEQVTP